MKRRFRNWIIGENNYVQSWNEFRQIMLSAQYALVSLVVLGIYICLGSPAQSPETFACFIAAFVFILFSLLLHRLRHHCFSNILLFLVFNAVIFLIGSSESMATGAFLFLIPTGLGIFSVFNYSQRKLAFCFVILSILLFGVVLIHPFSILPFRVYSDAEIRSDQLINFGIAFPVSVVAIYLLNSLNYYNAKSLKKANSQLSKLNEELDRFVYSTSHDLRAPLRSIKGLVTLSKTANPDEQANYLHLIDKRMDSLDRFISDITDYSRNNRLEIIKENVNVAELISDIWESLQHSPEARCIEFINEIPGDLVVLNDARRMEVVLTNLIGNAIRYHDRHKDHQYIRLYYQTTGESFSLHIEDNGLGVDPTLHGKIFDMFFRGNEKSQGTGLGLYIVKETLSKLSGSVLLQSVPYEGSTFSITLPRH
ncbi:MAG: ATP-binding protein [Bacteroidetes bacterium]|nr:ATP-binding protein [Bacteroidota bacterium]